MDTSRERRIIIVGENGSGKSTIGNSLLGKYAFSHRKLTQCRQNSGVNKLHDISLSIVDTPGLFDTEVPLARGALEIQRSVDICPDPHAFLIVVTANSDLNKNKYIAMTVDMLRVIFGENIFDNAIVMLTQGDDSDIDSWLVDNLLMSLCGERVVIAKTFEECMDQHTVNAILKQIRTMICNGIATYSRTSIGTQRKFLEEYMSIYREENSVHAQICELKQRLEAGNISTGRVQNIIKFILIGKSGNGKSSTGNTLLGYAGFPVGKSLKAVTEKCAMKTGFLKKQEIRVVDTPGLFDTGNSLIKRALEIQKAVYICPYPNAFLLVLSSANRLTDEEIFTVDLMRIMFGEKIFEHVIIVFTRGSEFKDEADFIQFWKDECFKDLVQQCKGRIFKIENSNHSQDEAFQNLIETIKDCPVYQYRHLDVHKAALEEHLQHPTSSSQDMKQQIEVLVKNIGIKLDPGLWNPKLFACVAILTLASGGAGLAAPIVGIEASATQISLLGAVLGSTVVYFKQRFWSKGK